VHVPLLLLVLVLLLLLLLRAGRRLAQKDKCGGLSATTCSSGARRGWGCCLTGTTCGTCNLRPKMKQTVATCASTGCQYTCTAKWGDCNTDMSLAESDGCEVSRSHGCC
jgi:hypothetical protein